MTASTSKILGVLLIAGFLGFAGYKAIKSSDRKGDNQRSSTPVVKAERPIRRTIARTLSFTGDILPDRAVTVYAKVGGALQELRSEVGDRVRTSDVLAVIDSAEYAQAYKQAAATRQNAAAAHRRALDLAKRDLISKAELDNADAALAIADAALELAQLKLGYTVIRAPFAGVVTNRRADEGSLVAANNTPLYDLMSYDRIRVQVEVGERETPNINIGAEVLLQADAYPGERFPGRVARRSESVDLKNRTMMVEVEAANPGLRLKPGMFAIASVLLERRENALTAPTQAILRDDGGYYVWKIDSGISSKQSVQIGAVQSDITEVLAGLTESDSLSVLGFQALKDGGKVVVASGLDASVGGKPGR